MKLRISKSILKLLAELIFFNLFTSAFSIAPVITVISTIDGTSYIENSKPVTVVESIYVTDFDGMSDNVYAIVTVSKEYMGDQDELASPHGLFDKSTGVLTISGIKTADAFQKEFRNVTYYNNSENPSAKKRGISFQIIDKGYNDGRFFDIGGISNIVTCPVEVVAVNDAPTASNVNITGTNFIIGSTLTLNNIYSDPENNPEGNSFYQWYTSTSPGEEPKTSIPGANSKTYTITTGEANKYIGASVRPYDNQGLSGNVAISSFHFVDAGVAPTASLSDNIKICDNGSPGAALNVNLTSNNPPVVFTYQKNGGTIVTISVSNISTPYKLNVSDTGTYTLISVRDNVYSSGSLLSTTGKVSYFPKTGATFTSDTLKLCAGDESSITVKLQGMSPWNFKYKIDGGAERLITGISSQPHQLAVNTSGKYTISTVTDGNGCSATGTGFKMVTIKSDPKATMTIDTVWACPGSTASVSIELTGNALPSEANPWRLFYTINNGAEKELTNITKPNYFIKTPTEGVYRITKVFDAANNEGCTSGTKTVLNYAVPTASIDGTKNICEGASTTFNVTLTGTPPWKFSYRYKSSNPDTVKGISNSPYGLKVSKEGTYTLVGVHDKYCPGTASGIATLDLKPAPEVSISGLKSIYDNNTISDPIVTSPSGGNLTALPKANSILTDEGITRFYSMIAGLGSHKIKYQYASADGCIGKDSVQVVVISDKGLIKIVDNHLDTLPKLCYNIDSVLIVGYKLGSSSSGVFTISGSSDAISDLGNDTAYIFPKIIKTGDRTVTYSYTVGGVPKSATRKFSFETLKADFDWDNECIDNDNKAIVTFTDKSKFEGATAEHNFWKITSSNIYKEFDNPNIAVEFNKLDTIKIEHRVVSNYGCDINVKKQLILRPTINPKNIPYLEDFSEGAAYWSSQSIIKDSLNTWTLGRPLGQIFNAASGSNAWYTSVLDNKKAESSYVISPCFDFSASNKPMIKMKIWRGFVKYEEIDGATLQFTTDNGNNWSTVGSIDDGINWYNKDDIEGSPGGYKIGWTEIQDNDWVECRHTLDKVIGKNRVRFRIAYGAPTYNFERDGIAFDDIWIGERTKKVLVEHFTNSSSGKCVAPDANLNLLANKNAIDVIDLQYHMNYPEADTFYNFNSTPSSSRELYYSIANVPYSLINGGGSGNIIDYTLKELEEKDLILASLKDNKFYLKADGEFGDYTTGDVLPITVDIQAQTAISNRTVTLYIVLTENEIKGITGANGQTVFESVVRDIIPISAENTFDRSWAAGEKETREFEWTIMEGINVEKLRIVAFLQDENTQEIYQASIDNPNVISGIKENVIKSGRSFLVYPNPASGNATIQWSEPLIQNCVIEINDFLGRVVWQGTMNAGEIESTIPLNRINAGTYIVRPVSNDKPVETQKLIVVK